MEQEHGLSRKTPPRRAAIYGRGYRPANRRPENPAYPPCERWAERAGGGWAVVCEYVETASGASPRAAAGLDAMVKDAARRRFERGDGVGCVAPRAIPARSGWTCSRHCAASAATLFLEQQALDTSTPRAGRSCKCRVCLPEFERAMIVGAHESRDGPAPGRAGKQIGRAPASYALIDAIRALRADGMGMDRIARKLKMRQGP